jgi:hypothetical protein
LIRGKKWFADAEDTCFEGSPFVFPTRRVRQPEPAEDEEESL